MEMALTEMTVQSFARPNAVEAIVEDICSMRSLGAQIAIVNVAIELLDAHVCSRPCDTRCLKAISRARPVPIAEQEPILDAIEMVSDPLQRRGLLDELRALKRRITYMPSRPSVA